MSVKNLCRALILTIVSLSSAQGQVEMPVRAPSEAIKSAESAEPTVNLARTENGILYHGGPIMHGTTKIYYIWYGDWNNTAVSILTDLAFNIAPSPYFNINTSYWDYTGEFAANSVTFGGSYFAGYSLDNIFRDGKTLSKGDIISLVWTALDQDRLPIDSHGAYFVLTSVDVYQTNGSPYTLSNGFCNSFCAWHDQTEFAGKKIKYGFVGNPERCPDKCSGYNSKDQITPNNDFGGDSMASPLAHELEEMVTDPNLSAWYDQFGLENADKCVWTFGETYITANGAKANMKLGNRDYLIQRNWVNDNGGYCTLEWKAPIWWPARARGRPH